MDILLTGQNSGGQRISRVYINNSVENGTTYAAPTAPTNLVSTIDAANKQVTLSWDAATDNSTPSASLSYNVYIREQGATNYRTSPQALEADGWRLLPALGNAQLGTSYIWRLQRIEDLNKTFEWRVQAIDHGYLGGVFSTETSFEILPPKLTLSGTFEIADKVYDGDATAVVSSNALTLDGILLGAEDVTIESIEFSFPDKQADTDKEVSITNITLGGTDAGIYTLDLTGAPTATADITPADLILSGLAAENKVYDGNTVATLTGTPSITPIGSDVVTVSGSAEGNFAQANVGTAIPVSVSGLSLSGADQGNYTLVLPSLLADITPATLTITVDTGQEKVFGTTDPIFTYVATGFATGDDVSVLSGSLARVAGEDVGTYAITQGSLAANANYSIDFTGADFTITPATITGITFADASFTYDGTEKSLAITGALPTGTSVSYTNNSRTDVGTQEVTATITGANYTTLVLTADLTITPATITGVTFEDGSFTYDGIEKSLAITGTLPTGTTVSYTNNGRTDAGTQEVTATITGANYTTLVLTADLEITPATITGITFEDASFTYDGIEKFLAITGTLPTGTTVSYTNNGRTDAGTQEVTATITGANYTTLVLTADLEITPATITGITFEDASFTYDGIEKFLAITGALPAGTTVSYTNNDRTDVGTQEVTATITGANYMTLVLTADLTITPATITGVTFEDGSFTYDGTEKSLAITGTLPTGTSVSYANNGRTDAGTQEVTATITGANYTTLVLTADLEITPATITGITFEDASFTYDGIEKFLAITGTLPTGTTVSYANNSRTDAGTQEVTATITGANYTTLVLTADLEITPATITGITFEDASFTYDGIEKFLAITGALPAGTTVSYTNNDRTDVGTQEVTATITGANYMTLVLTADLTITPATITGVTFEDGSFTYDGTEKSLAITGTLPTGASVSYTSNGRTDVGTQEVTATITGANYTTLVLTADLTITPATPTLSWEDITATFGAADLSLTPPSSTSTGAFTYSIADTQVAVLTGDVLSLRGLAALRLSQQVKPQRLIIQLVR